MSQHDLLILHASRASVEPVSEYYLREAAALRPVNVLDEGVMGRLHARDWDRAVARLSALVAQSVEEYGIYSALVTCSALGPVEMAHLRDRCSVPAMKIDEPMLQAAAAHSGKIGLLATFPATAETSLQWLRHFSPAAEVEVSCDRGPLDDLLAGDSERHDAGVLRQAMILAGAGASLLVLAQVSMARLAPAVRKLTGVAVVESLSSSLRGVLAGDKLNDRI